MINNGAILLRYGHSVFVKNNSTTKTIDTESFLPILAQRLIAELHRSPTLLDFNNNNNNSFSTIKVKNKYFEANLSCVLVDDNLVVHQQEDGKAEVGESTFFTSISQEVIASLRCGRIPYGIVQIVDMAQLSTQALLTDQECAGRNNNNNNGNGNVAKTSSHAKNKFDAPLFNLCLVVASASDYSSLSSKKSNNNNPLNLLQPGQQHQYQKWKEVCVDLGIECVPWILTPSSDSSKNNNNVEVRMSISRPVPPPLGIEKRGLLQSMKDGELTGSSRVLEVLNQSLWCTFDPMLAMKVKERTLLRDSNDNNNTVNIFEGIYHENLIGLISSSRFTCEFSKNLFDRVPGIQETKFLSSSENSEENNNNNNYLFVGSGGDDQNFSATFQLGDSQHKKSTQCQVADLNIYFSPLQMMIQNSYLSRLGAAEIEKMLGIPSCKIICFHLLMTDIVALFPSSSSPSIALVNALTSIRNILQLLNEEIFTKRIKLGNDLGCLILVQNNLQNDKNENLLQKINEEPIVFDLMQLGCETVVVDDETDNGKLWDKEEGAIGLNRIGEILSCLSSSWKSNDATKIESIEKRRLKSPLEKNSVVLVSVEDEQCNNNHNNISLLASFIAKSFSDDNEETLSSAHDKKTQWLKKEILLSCPSSASSLSVSVYPVDLSTKYYCANVDVIVVKVTKSSEATVNEIHEEICTILDISNAQAFLVYLNPINNHSNEGSEKINEVQLLFENTCLVGEDDDEPAVVDDSEKPNFKFLVGPHSDKIALVVIDNSKNDFPSSSSSSSSSLQEYCQENFIEFITTTSEEEEEECSEDKNVISPDDGDESRKSMTLTQKVFDTLSCVDWKNVSKKDRPAVTSTTSALNNQKRAENLLLQNIHDGTEGYYSENFSSRSNDVPESKNLKSQTSSSAIESAMKSLVNSSGAAGSTDPSKPKNNTSSIVFTCEIPKSTHRYDRVLKKTVLRRNDDESTGKSSSGKKNEDDDDAASDASSEIIEDDNDMSELLQQMRDVRDSKRLTREERQLRAEELSKQFAKKLHKDDDLADALVKNLL